MFLKNWLQLLRRTKNNFDGLRRDRSDGKAFVRMV